jgi:nucleoside-diphosphate-sugar epimerase
MSWSCKIRIGSDHGSQLSEMATKLIVGCGYLGSRIAALWREQGHRVFATTRRPERSEELTRLGIEAVLCDVLDPGTLIHLPIIDSVVHSVGLDRAAGVSMRRVYVDGLSNVLDALPTQPRFVHISSTSVYGQASGEEVDEDAATAPTEESGAVVLEAERLLRQRRPDAVILRFAGIYGPGRLLRRAAALRAGEAIATNPEGWLNLVHVEDGARIAVEAEESAAPGTVFNVSDGRPVWRRDFYTRLAELLGAPAPRFTAWQERINRRIVSKHLRSLGVELRFPSYLEGLLASV